MKPETKWNVFFGAGGLGGLLLMLGAMGLHSKLCVIAIPVGMAVSVMVWQLEDSKRITPSLRSAASFGFLVAVVGISLVLTIAYL